MYLTHIRFKVGSNTRRGVKEQEQARNACKTRDARELEAREEGLRRSYYYPGQAWPGFFYGAPGMARSAN